MKRIDEDLIRGGCGHTSEELHNDVNAIFFFAKIGIAAILAIAGYYIFF